jgi:hypothetical protein
MNGIASESCTWSSSTFENPVTVAPESKGTPDGDVAFRKTQGPWQTAAMGFLDEAKVWIRAREVGSVVRSNIAGNIAE